MTVEPGMTVRLALDGGTPVRMRTWPTYDTGDVFIQDSDVQAAETVLRRRLYFRYDHRDYAETETGALEAGLCAALGTAHTLTCCSGTAAIALSLMALGLPPGSPVACPAFTFAATPSAIMLAGHRPVLVECDEDLHLDVADLRRKLTPDVRAIVVVHMRGFASDMPAIMALADERGVPVVEDAVPALGVRLGGRSVGTFGTLGAFSTQSDKSLNTGEGGFLVTDDPGLYARAVVYSGAYEGRMARHFPCAAPPLDDLALPIFGMRMDEIRAALARAMLTALPDRLAAHRRNYLYVAERLAGLEPIRLRDPVAPDAFLGEALVFRLPGARPRTAAWFAEALRAEGISARALGDRTDPNVRAFWNWRFLFPDPGEARAAYPVTARLISEAVDVPLSANLQPEDCDELVAAIHKVAAALPDRA